jgi:hypothetical protein
MIAVRWIVIVLIAVHGLIHLMGFAKAYGYAELPQLSQPVSRVMGLVWLTAGLVVFASALLMVAWPRGWWIVGAVTLAISQAVIVTAWHDAWAGTIPNIILLAAVVHGCFTEGPRSARAQFEKDVALGLARPLEAPRVTEADLAPLPEPVQHYLRAVGVVGNPRVQNYRLRFRGRIRSGPDTRWMPFEANQQSFADRPARLFLMHARMYGLPVEAFHRMIDGHATMRVKMAGVVPIVDARGDVMDRSETVTHFNDMCLLAPGTLIDPHIVWEPVDAHTVRARYSGKTRSISATLVFGEDGLLTNFISDDRSRASTDGKTFTQARFSTPVRDYRNFGAIRLAAHGEARWHLPEGEFTYGEFDLLNISYNVNYGAHDDIDESSRLQRQGADRDPRSAEALSEAR